MSFYKPEKLPKLMVAPNGARKVKKDHPAVPLTISETVATAKSCYEAGAGAIHLHVRDNKGQHVLDAGLYKEALNELEYQVPNMHIQVTTEAVGKYSPADMRKLAYDVKPPGVSIGTSELIPSRNPENEDIKLYKYLTEAGTKIQHILYQPEDIDKLEEVALVHSYGLILKENEESVTLIADFMPVSKEFGRSTTIPKGMIKNMTHISTVE